MADRQKLIAPDYPASAIHRAKAIAVSVKGKTNIVSETQTF